MGPHVRNRRRGGRRWRRFVTRPAPQAAAAAAGTGPRIRIIHINYNHARFDPADAQFGTQCEGSAAAACFGGFARQAAAVSQAKAAAASQGMDPLVLHAGDEYTGSLWDAIYTKAGVQVAPAFLRQLGVQAMAVGNHEFDFGPTGDAGLEGAFPLLSCNLDASEEPALAGLVQRFSLIDLELSIATVGVVGLTTVGTPATSNSGPNLRFLPYVEALPACVADARAAGADFIIALTHIGFDSDLQLAADPAAAGVDLFVGGHSHTLLWGEPPPAGQPQMAGRPPAILASPAKNESTEAQGPYPTLVLNVAAGNKTIPVVQALYASRYLGVLDTTWELGKGLVGCSGQPVLLGGANSTNPVPEHPEVAAQLAALRGPIDAVLSLPAGIAAVHLEGGRGRVRNGETNLGDLLFEAMRWHIASTTGLLRDNADMPPICLINGGAIRASIPAGNVTQGQVEAVLPFGNWLLAKAVDASTLVAALNSGLSGWTGDSSAQGRFPQVGGLRYAFDPTRDSATRLVSAEVLVNGSALPLASFPGSLILLTTNYLAEGGDFYAMVKEGPTLLETSATLDAILADYFVSFTPIDIATDGRIVNCNGTGASTPLCLGTLPPAAGLVPVPPVLAVPPAPKHPRQRHWKLLSQWRLLPWT